MSFREKTVWVSLLSTLAIWGWYFVTLALGLRDGRAPVESAVVGFLIAVVLIVVVQVAATVTLAILNPKEAEARADAREREIDRSAGGPAYVTLSVLVVMIMLATPVIIPVAPKVLTGDPAAVSGFVIGNALLAALVLAELVHSGWQLFRYRQQG